MVCPYCGSKELILESDEVTIERIRNATYKDIEHEKMSFEQAKYNYIYRLIFLHNKSIYLHLLA